MLTRLVVVIILQHIQILNHYSPETNIMYINYTISKYNNCYINKYLLDFKQC